jgi:aminotransferase
LQAGGVAALGLPDAYYREMQADYEQRREYFLGVLRDTGFRFHPPEGAYYVMADISDFGFEDDRAFARYLTEEVGVAVVPGSSFYQDPGNGAGHVRFCFCKSQATLEAAAERLMKLPANLPGR